jgi:hypothetical protein
LFGLSVQYSSAEIVRPIFSEDFESGTLSNWTTFATSPLAISTARTFGQYSAQMDVSTDRMHRNLIADNGGVELTGHIRFTSYQYDASGTATRFYNEIRSYSNGTGFPNGGATANGTLSQLLAIGKYNTVTMTGETYKSTKYQARISAGTKAGWFNLDATGSPNRSTGWHKFQIDAYGDGKLEFYVDDILSRTIDGATVDSFDTLILGPGLGTTVGDAYFDNLSVAEITQVPEPGALALLASGALSLGLLVLRGRRGLSRVSR